MGLSVLCYSHDSDHCRTGQAVPSCGTLGSPPQAPWTRLLSDLPMLLLAMTRALLDSKSLFQVAVTAYSADISNLKKRLELIERNHEGLLDFKPLFQVAVTVDAPNPKEGLELIKCSDDGLLDLRPVCHIALGAGSAYIGNLQNAVARQLLGS